MKAQPKRFVECGFESVSSDSFDIYKITSPLVKIIEVSEKSSGRFVGGVVVNDTMGDTICDTTNNTINDTTNLLSDNERIVFDEMQVQIKLNLVGLSYEI